MTDFDRHVRQSQEWYRRMNSIRHEQSKTLHDMARLCHVDVHVYAAWELGARVPTPVQKELIEMAFGVAPGEVFGELRAP